MTNQLPPAGWHPDPYGTPGLLRWWDGTQWTSTTAPAPAGYGSPTQRSGGGEQTQSTAEPTQTRGDQPQPGQHEPQFGQGQPQLGQHEPRFGQHEPQFGRHEPQFGQHEPQFGRDQPGSRSDQAHGGFGGYGTPEHGSVQRETAQPSGFGRGSEFPSTTNGPHSSYGQPFVDPGPPSEPFVPVSYSTPKQRKLRFSGSKRPLLWIAMGVLALLLIIILLSGG